MNSFKNTLYNIERNSAKKYLTGNLGKVFEDEEKITCYVEKSKVKKKNYKYTIACFGIGEDEDKKKIAKAFKLDKPICYVIDGLKLNKHQVYIFGYDDCEVIIKNCSFELDLWVHVNGKCTLDNTNIKTFSYLSLILSEIQKKQLFLVSLFIASQNCPSFQSIWCECHRYLQFFNYLFLFILSCDLPSIFCK